MDLSKLYNVTYLEQLAKNSRSANQKFVKRLKSRKPKKLDELFFEQHEEKFSEIDCLDCASCCKELGPRILDKDIERMAKAVNMKQQAFIEQYLKTDEDKDYVFKSMPCPF